MRLTRHVAVVGLLLATGLGANEALAKCPEGEDAIHPTPTPGKKQYIIGYGSLMNEASKRIQAPNASDAVPVRVWGYERGFFHKTESVGFNMKTTFLGIKASEFEGFNAALYEIPAGEIRATDERENGYCRVLVNRDKITVLGTLPLPVKGIALAPKDGEIWIYESMDAQVADATDDIPIVQSYVDIFLEGCIDLEKKFGIDDFAKECITTTTWSDKWVNDRPQPRRPAKYFPKAKDVDKLLKDNIPKEFAAIKLDRSS